MKDKLNKYFISCIQSNKQLGAMQFESKESEYQKKAEELCPQKASFRAYVVDEFDDGMPINEFVAFLKMKELGY